ncbi:hypothetical protein SteCoe_4809 [Stentor coeruleus]|uniref:Protein kinase domain-containing protein n=1 Tax=Stentor coeruleus TaxID=5963 RepID=A0A1R2CTY7_9CILI|nr:hypothetical protein SteCoe_4809 [Stentor coeruleus]
MQSSSHSSLNNYEFIKKLGQGTFGKVKLFHKSHQNFAIKCYNRGFLRRKKLYYRLSGGSLSQNTALDAVYREMNLMKKLTHQNVLKLYEIIEDENIDKAYMVMDYCEKGPIMEWNSKSHKFFFPWTSEITEYQLRKIFRDIVCGLEYLHSLKIIHRDLKPQNILLCDNWVVKIGDFGQAQEFGDDDMQTSTVGTYFFFPPESCNPENSSFSGRAADVWALGITLYALVYRCLPFWAQSLAGIFEVIQQQVIQFPQSHLVDEDLRDIMVRILDKNPQTRIKMHELIQHPWLLKDCNPLGTPGVTVFHKENNPSNALNFIRIIVRAVRII